MLHSGRLDARQVTAPRSQPDGNGDCNVTAQHCPPPSGQGGVYSGSALRRTGAHEGAASTDQKVWGSNPYGRATPWWL